MSGPAAEIARRLAENAEAVCRRYLPNGRREGQYWLVGDIHNTRGRSLYIRLSEQSDGLRRPGKWTDAASGEHGDLLDIIAASCGHTRFRDTLEEARRFLSLPPEPPSELNAAPRNDRPGSPEAARRLWAGSQPLAGSAATAYLAARAITDLGDCRWLRFHPRCFYRPSQDDAPGIRRAWPALIAGVTDETGTIMGVHRTWLDAGARVKAPVASPRRAMGRLLGHGVRFGTAGRVMAAGEGIETILALKQICPAMPMISALSAAHLAAIAFPAPLRRLYVARDDDRSGAAALAELCARAAPLGIEVIGLEPQRGDFNADLLAFGRSELVAALRPQLDRSDAAFLA